MASEQFPTRQHPFNQDYEPRYQDDFVVKDDEVDPLAYERGPVMPFRDDGDEEKDQTYGDELQHVLDQYPDDEIDEDEAA